ERFDPSMTKRPLSANPQRLARLWMRALISALSSGLKELNSGAITVGNSHSSRKLNATHRPQAHQIQFGPVLPMIHNTQAASGVPKTRDSASVLTVSWAKSLGVTRLKP